MRIEINPQTMTRGELLATAAFLTGLADLVLDGTDRSDVWGDCEPETKATTAPTPVGPTATPSSAPAVASAPAAPPPPAPINEDEDDDAEAQPVDTSMLDSLGLPWDARIHAESKKQIADGTWRKRRNVTQEEFDRVAAELRAAIGGSPAPTPAAPPPPAAAPVEGNAPPPPQPVVAPAPNAPTAPPPSAPAAAASATDVGGRFASFADLVTACAALGQEVSSFARLGEKAKLLDLSEFKDLQPRPDLYDAFYMLVSTPD